MQEENIHAFGQGVSVSILKPDAAQHAFMYGPGVVVPNVKSENSTVPLEAHTARVRELLNANNRLVEDVRAQRRKVEALTAELRDLRRIMYRDQSTDTT